MHRECLELFSGHRFQRKPLVSDPGMHHGTCVAHVPWYMSGSLTRGGGENVPGIPGACAPAILRIWQEAHSSHVSSIAWDVFWRRLTKWYWDLTLTESECVYGKFYYRLYCPSVIKNYHCTATNYRIAHKTHWNEIINSVRGLRWICRQAMVWFKSFSCGRHYKVEVFKFIT